jgi:hypothetical protein
MAEGGVTSLPSKKARLSSKENSPVALSRFSHRQPGLLYSWERVKRKITMIRAAAERRKTKKFLVFIGFNITSGSFTCQEA